MKNIILSALSLAVPALGTAQCITPDAAVEAQVERLLADLSLEQKVGQMCELTVGRIAPLPGFGGDRNRSMQTLAGGLLSASAVDEVFGQYGVGSILNVPNDEAQTPDVWADVIRTLNRASAFHSGGIPQLYGVDQIHGASYTRGATLFPQEIGQAASFNVAIPRRIGEITAYETRACLIPWVYSPVMDLARSPLWSRMWESFGEDVLLNARMATALTLGLQGSDPNHIGPYNVAACLKHYMAYGAAVSGKDRTPSSVTERELMEKYFPAFRACCEAGALSIMVNSANNNGIPFHCNRTLLTEWLKEGLHWDGMIVTDWADIDNLWKRDHVAASKKDAIALAINAGIDMSMDPYSTDFCPLLLELVREGRVPMERIDDAVRRILRLKIRVGLLDPTTWDLPFEQELEGTKFKKGQRTVTLESRYPDFASPKFAAEAVSMAEECMVLLKNSTCPQTGQATLPLKPGTRLFVCGPNADNFRPMNGGWSYTWQGHRTDEICREIGIYHTFLSALEAKFGKDNVSYSPMVAFDNGPDWRADHQVPEILIEDGNRTADKIAAADVIIACIGENSYCETPGNIDDLTLSRNQLDMVQALAQSGKPVILVLTEGRPRLITDIEPLAAAVVHTFLPGNYGGEALANLLSGEANFSGRLPYTYPRFHGSFSTYDSKPCENVATMEGAYNYSARTDILYGFGHGLSYTTVDYGALTMEREGDVLRFTVDVTNTGDRAVKEPILLYVSDLVASLTPDVKRLRAFTKVELAPGECKTVTLEVKVCDLAFVNTDLQWVVEPGEFLATVAGLALKFEL